MTFTGFPAPPAVPMGAVDFYVALEAENTRAWWAAHTEVYTRAVREPFLALLDTLADEFGEATVFRPHRDVRFSADKSPYKTHQGGYVATFPGAGWYVQLSPEGLTTGAGFYRSEPDQVARYRAAVDAAGSGQALATAVEAVRRKGFEVGGDVLRSRPRGVAADHPRLDLLRHRTLLLTYRHGEPDWLATTEAAERVRADWRTVRPVVAWLSEHVGASATTETGGPRGRR